MDRRQVDELEVIDIDPEGHVLESAGAVDPAARYGGRGSGSDFQWRRPAVIVPIIVVALVATVVGPVRTLVNTRALERMEHILVVSIGLEREADDRSASLVRTNPAVGDDAFLRALETLTKAHLAELRRLRSDLPAPLLLSDRLRAARKSLNAYLDRRIREVDLLHRHGPSGRRTLSVSAAALKDRRQADLALADERKRRGGERDELRFGDVELPSLTEVAAELRRPSDQRTGLSIVAAGIDGLTMIDLDTGRVTGDGNWHGEAPTVVSENTIAWLSDPAWFEPTGREVSHRIVSLRGDPNDLISAMTANLSSIQDRDQDPVQLKRVIRVVKSPRPNAVWLEELAPDGRRLVREVDSKGETLQGPSPMPAGFSLFGAVEPGLVIEGDTILVWRPSDGQVVRQIGDEYPRPIALGGDTLLWARGRSDAEDRFLTKLSSGVERPVVAETYGVHWLPGAVSPDGNRVAIATSRGWRVDELDSGATHEIPGAPMAAPVWSPDSRHVFLPTTTQGYRRRAVIGAVETLLRWDVASREAVALRFRENEWPYWGFAIVETP